MTVLTTGAPVGAKRPLHVPTRVGRMAAGEAVVSMMTAAGGSSDAKAKAVLGWTSGHPTWPYGIRAWAAEDQRSNTLEAA
jgi:hypothetical protein